MSFQQSRRIPTFAEHEPALREALVDVAEQTYFAFTSPGDESIGPAGADDAGDVWLSAVVRFKGAFCGTLEIIMPDPLARSLLTALLGMDPGEMLSADQVYDSTGEFANIVCGTWLTRVARTRHFDLAAPVVTRLPAARPPGSAVASIEMRVNDMPLRLQVEFSPFDA